MAASMKYRILISTGLGLLTFLFITAKWHVVADYYGEADCNFVLSGFPLPYIVDWGIISRFGNSGDTAINALSLTIDIVFYVALVFGVTFVRGKIFTQPTQAMKVLSTVLCVVGVACTGYYFWMVISTGDLHPWFENGYRLKAVEFMNADEIFKNMK